LDKSKGQPEDKPAIAPPINKRKAQSVEYLNESENITGVIIFEIY